MNELRTGQKGAVWLCERSTVFDTTAIGTRYADTVIVSLKRMSL
jgi:hypothetical protein